MNLWKRIAFFPPYFAAYMNAVLWAVICVAAIGSAPWWAAAFAAAQAVISYIASEAIVEASFK